MTQEIFTPPKDGEGCIFCVYPKQIKTKVKHCMICSHPKADKEHKSYIYPPGYGCSLFTKGARKQKKIHA